ncbi:MAG: TauD/TfdA family dioxygenase [Pseudomonadota bacterium]
MTDQYHLDTLIVDVAKLGQQATLDLMQQKLMHERAAVLRNTGMTELNQMAQWSDLLGLCQMDYSGGAGHREDLGSGVLSVGTEPHYCDIEPHSEMCYWTSYPKYILFGCIEIPSNGGETVIADNRKVTQEIRHTATGEKIYQRGVRYYRRFFDATNPDSIPSTKSWQENFGCEDIAGLEALCTSQNWDLIAQKDGSVEVSYAEIGYEFDTQSKSNLLFISMARLARAFDDWPPYNELPDHLRPFDMTYANGDAFSQEDLDCLQQSFARHSIAIHWQPGDIAVLDNIIWPHARPPYQLLPGEHRKIGVLVSESVPRQRIVI